MVQNLDDCYVHSRLPNGTLVPDPVAFPSGMRALADYVHSKQMLFGVYTARCAETCAGRPASLGHEAIDAHTFAIDWDADYLKEDSCRGCTNQDPMELYMTMEAALNATGKPVRTPSTVFLDPFRSRDIFGGRYCSTCAGAPRKTCRSG